MSSANTLRDRSSQRLHCVDFILRSRDTKWLLVQQGFCLSESTSLNISEWKTWAAS